jgi:hypothetical protein
VRDKGADVANETPDHNLQRLDDWEKRGTGVSWVPWRSCVVLALRRH